jgi:ATP-dependent DNA helicase RecG
MEADEKRLVIKAMHDKSIDILVSSTVIEVGVTLPSLRALIVMHPERQGASQLHQLRGRLVRKGGSGYMFLQVGDGVDEDSMARLQLLVDCSDGFTLSEKDMDLRGFGDVQEDGDTQTGSTRTLFWGVHIRPSELATAAAAIEDQQSFTSETLKNRRKVA